MPSPKIIPKESEIQHKLVSDSFLHHLGIKLKRYKDNPYRIIEDINEVLSYGEEGNHLIGLITQGQQNLIVECYLLYSNFSFFVAKLGQETIDNITKHLIDDIQNSDVSRCNFDHFQNVLSYLTAAEAQVIVDAIKDKMSEVKDKRSLSQINFGTPATAT